MKTILLIYFGVDTSEPPRDDQGEPTAPDTNGQVLAEPTVQTFVLEGKAQALDIRDQGDREQVLNLTDTQPHKGSQVIFVQADGEETVSIDHTTGAVVTVFPQTIRMG